MWRVISLQCVRRGKDGEEGILEPIPRKEDVTKRRGGETANCGHHEPPSQVEFRAFGDVAHPLDSLYDQENRNDHHPTLRFEFTMATRARHTRRCEHLAEG